MRAITSIAILLFSYVSLLCQSETEILEKIRAANPCSTVEISILYQGKEHNYSVAGDSVVVDTELDQTPKQYEIGSISKLFCGILAQEAILEGKLTLSTTIGTLLPQDMKMPEDISSITVQELMTHTSGLPRLPGNLFLAKGFDMNDPYAQYDSTLLYNFLESYDGKLKKGEPSYSNLGAGLLGHLLSSLQNQEYNDLVKQRIFDPLSMKNTTSHNATSNDNKMMPVYNECTLVSPWNFKVLSPAGSIKSTLEDITVFAKACMTASENNQVAIFNSFKPLHKQSERRSKGSFWIIGKLKGHTMYGHSGRTAGSASSLIIVPEMELAAVLLNNSSRVLESELFELIKLKLEK